MSQITISQKPFKFEFRQTLYGFFKEKGVKAFKGDRDEWYWLIDTEQIDINDLKSKLGEKFPDDTVNFINQIRDAYTTIKPLPFVEILNNIDNTVKAPPTTYKFGGDVYNISQSGNNMFIELIDNLDIWRKVQVYYYIDDYFVSEDDFKDKRVEVTGKLCVHNGVLQVKATTIKIIGSCTRLQKIAQWRQENKNLFIIRDKQHQKVEYFPIEKIGLIATEDSHGYRDFTKKLYPSLGKLVQPKFVKISDIDEIVQAIEEYNEEKTCSCICIVRGGGNSYDLLKYSDPELLRAIHESKIKIITGIAHSTDELLCDYVADYCAQTPTDAADYINRIYNLRPDKLHKNDELLRLQQENLELKIQVENLTHYIKQLEQQLTDNQKKGWFSRLFG